MIPWRFILFSLAIAVVVYLHFYFAHRQWRRLKGKQSGEIDVDYVRIENFIPRSFRLKVKEWLQLPATADNGGAGRIILKGRERIRSTGPLAVGSRQQCDDILVVDGDFFCGPGCEFDREIYARGAVRIGRGSRLQSLATDSSLVLEEGTRVARWLDSAGEMDLGADCHVGARVTSLKAVRLGIGVRAASVFAPEVSSAGWDGNLPADMRPASQDLLEVAAPASSPLPAESLAKAGLDAARFVQLSPDCWCYMGDLHPNVPLWLKTKLVVKRSCRLPGGSIIANDLKVHGWLSVGPSSVCEGSLVAGGDILLARGCRFCAVIHAAGSLMLSAGARGYKENSPVVAYAAEDLWVESDVLIAGKLASASRVAVVDAASAEKWIVQRRMPFALSAGG